jgi:tetratricopeptide (TPR) repeat protein
VHQGRAQYSSALEARGGDPVSGATNRIFCFKTLTLSSALLVACSLAAFAGPDSAIVLDEQLDSIFDVANEEYKAGNYENAITLYEGLLSGSGAKATDVHYNMGNAFFKLGNYGKAIAAYRRALELSPRDQDVIANLGFARQATLDRIDQTRSAQLWREVLFFHYGLAGAETEAIFICVYFAAAALGIVLLFRESRQLKWLASITLFFALMFGASYTIKWRAAANPSEAVVVTKEADVHTGPGGSYIVSFSLHDGAEVRMHKLEDDWRQVELADGRRGWIERTNIEPI